MTAYLMQLYYFLTRRWSLSYWQTRAAALPQDLWHVDQEVVVFSFDYVPAHRVLSPRGAVIATFYGTPVSGLRQAVKYAERQNACYALSRQDYAAWIAKHYPTRESARHQCKQATINMVAEFPELSNVRGYVSSAGSYRHPHWWCVDLAGRIVDPTVHQWPVAVIPEDYEALPHDAEEPLGKCINCGDLCFRSRGATAFHCELCLTDTRYAGFEDRPR